MFNFKRNNLNEGDSILVNTKDFNVTRVDENKYTLERKDVKVTVDRDLAYAIKNTVENNKKIGLTLIEGYELESLVFTIDKCIKMSIIDLVIFSIDDTHPYVKINGNNKLLYVGTVSCNEELKKLSDSGIESIERNMTKDDVILAIRNKLPESLRDCNLNDLVKFINNSL